MKSCSKLDTIRSGGLQRREQALMREMGKLKRNQVPKLTTSAAGYWL